MIDFLQQGAVNTRYQEELEQAALRVLRSGRYILGGECEAFEREFAAYTGARYAAGVASGLDALTLTLAAMELPAGCEVIVPAHTFIASVFAVMQAGYTPVLAEPDDTCNIDPTQIERRLTSRTRAIMAVHLYGLPAAMEEINAIAHRYGLAVIEDASHAQGALLGEKKAGNLADAAGFSLYPTKNLGALGDAGIVTTNDRGLYERVLALRNYGCISRHDFPRMGRNSRLDELQAALLRVKLRHLDEDNARRRRLAAFYLETIRHPAVLLPHDEPGCVWHQFVVRCGDREHLRQHLAGLGVSTDIHYPVPPHRQTALAALDLPAYPLAERLAQEVLSLPMNPAVTDAQAEQIAAAVNVWQAGK